MRVVSGPRYVFNQPSAMVLADGNVFVAVLDMSTGALVRALG